MSHFVTPSDEKARLALENWFTVQLADNWGKGFKDGVLQLKVPPEMVKTDNRDDGDDQGENEGDNQGDENKDTEGTSKTTDLLASRYRSTKVHRCFSVTRETKPITLDNLAVPEKEPIVPTGGFKHFEHSLSTKDGLSGVRYYPDIVATVKVRHHLGISRGPFKGFRGGSLQWTTTTLPGVHQPYIYVSGKVLGSPFTMHVEDWNLYSLNYLHTGACKAWIVVRPRDRVRLEERARDYHAIINQDFRNDHFCSQFVRHLASGSLPRRSTDGASTALASFKSQGIWLSPAPAPTIRVGTPAGL
ncbi:MAG: hypothetical protein M1816_004152 [Peltula sp. TS41687]|nr:MAG: hypothetical protein M1816_004152 [Peltula sp. TS41687]